MSNYLTVHQNGEPIYDIFFANDFNSLPALLAGQGIADKRVCIVTESNVAPLYLEAIENQLRGKCKEIIRNAAIPSAVIFPSESKRETICCGNSWKSSVPMLIIIAVTQSVIFHAFLNLSLFLAP